MNLRKIKIFLIVVIAISISIFSGCENGETKITKEDTYKKIEENKIEDIPEPEETNLENPNIYEEPYR